MNITDVNDKEISIPSTVKDMISGIFERQKMLHDKYKHIEHNNGIGLHLIKDKIFSIDCPHCQYIVKDFAWRVTEELTEAMEAFFNDDKIHCIEEIIDALHFYTELLLICGYTSEDIYTTLSLDNIIKDSLLAPIYPLGLACNLLKNKPWKNTHLMTDEKRFKSFILEGYNQVLHLAISNGLNSIEGVYVVYMKKNLVNNFRINSNY